MMVIRLFQHIHRLKWRYGLIFVRIICFDNIIQIFIDIGSGCTDWILMESNNEECYLIAGPEYGALERKYLIVDRFIRGFKSTHTATDVWYLPVAKTSVNWYC